MIRKSYAENRSRVEAKAVAEVEGRWTGRTGILKYWDTGILGYWDTGILG
jgi:hypothetical protein